MSPKKNIKMRFTGHLIMLLGLTIAACQEQGRQEKSKTEITGSMQDSVFSYLSQIAGPTLSEEQKKDTLSFLILPLEASCPACLGKTIDSILKYQHHLNKYQIIIISLNAGKKRISSYFKERGGNLPTEANIILDTLNLSSRFQLHESNPTFYFTANKHAISKKVGLPATIKEDLHQFFNPS